jgi:6-phosphogluconolactonase
MKKDDAQKKSNATPFYVGTYTNKESKGIYKYFLQKDGSLKRSGLVARTENPSFLTLSADKKYLLAVTEVDRKGVGTVESFLIADDSLRFISSCSSGGAHPCFVTINEQGFVLTANYSGGNVGLSRLNKKGELSTLLDVQNHHGHSTHKNQQGPHAHSAWFVPSENRIIAVDLGTNDLWFSKLDTSREKLIPSDPQTLAMEPEAGPRHLVFHPNGHWIYVLNELDCTVTFVKKSENGTYNKGYSVSTLPIGYSEPNTGADIHISSDGKFLYASNRGHNSIVIYDVNAGNGSLSLLGHQPTYGDGPRNFALSPDDNFLLVANQHTNNIVSFKRDKTTGLLTEVDQTDAPTPVCIVF